MTEAAIEKYQFLNDNLDRQLGWIDKSDLRLAFIMPIALAMLASLASKAPVIDKWTVPIWISISFTVFFVGLTVVFCLCATFPRTDEKKPSNIFFGGITSKNIDDFMNQINSIDEQEVLSDLTFQIHINAQIAGIKYGWIQKALFTLMIASVFWGLTICALWLN